MVYGAIYAHYFYCHPIGHESAHFFVLLMLMTYVHKSSLTYFFVWNLDAGSTATFAFISGSCFSASVHFWWRKCINIVASFQCQTSLTHFRCQLEMYIQRQILVYFWVPINDAIIIEITGKIFSIILMHFQCCVLKSFGVQRLFWLVPTLSIKPFLVMSLHWTSQNRSTDPNMFLSHSNILFSRWSAALHKAVGTSPSPTEEIDNWSPPAHFLCHSLCKYSYIPYPRCHSILFLHFIAICD